jgi:hypothetical protein
LSLNLETVMRPLKPLAAALSNDNRLHEMGCLRAALEVDNRASLTRLALQDLLHALMRKLGVDWRAYRRAAARSGAS